MVICIESLLLGSLLIGPILTSNIQTNSQHTLPSLRASNFYNRIIPIIPFYNGTFSLKLPPALFFLLKMNLFCMERILHLFLSKNMFVLTDDCKPHFPLRLVHLVVFWRQSEGVLLAGTAEWNIKLRTL